MELQDSILKDFADAVNSNGNSTTSSQHIYGTVSRVVEDDLVYVRINGSELESPAKSLVKVGVNDTVMCTMQAHTLTIIGNISYPALTRIENVYMTLTEEGLLIGKLDDENNPYESYIVVGPSGTNIYSINSDGVGVLVASFGETSQLGKSSTTHLTMTPNGLAIRNGTDNGDYILANFTSIGMSFRDSNGNVLASFTNDTIKLGQSNTSATINLCGGQVLIGLSGTTMKIYAGSNVGAIGLSNSYSTYKSEVVCEAKSGSQRVAMQVLDGSTATASIVLSNDGANVTIPSGKALTENGKEVAKLDKLLAFGSITARGTIPGANNSVNQYGDVVLDPGEKSVTINVSNIPTGYTLCGIRGVMAQISNVLVEGYYCNPNNNKLTVTLKNYDYNAVTTDVYIYWFAIKNAGVSTQPNQSITW